VTNLLTATPDFDPGSSNDPGITDGAQLTALQPI